MAIARFNRHVTNPILGPIVVWIPGFCILSHQGRRTGRVYSIPMNVFRAEGGYVFALTYGSDTDWVKNVMAAGGCTIRQGRREIALERPVVLPTEQGRTHIPLPVRSIFALINVSEFLHLERSHRYSNSSTTSR